MKVKFIIFFTFLCLIRGYISFAQSKHKIQYLRISEDNDVFNTRGRGTDRYYTNGIRIDVYYTKHTAPKFLSKLLVPLNNSSDNIYAIGLTQQIFTPSDIQRTDVIVNERPYAGLLYGSHTLVSADYEKKQRLTTEIVIGVLGPASLAGETQTWVHEQIGAATPKGWANQVKNDIILSYQVRYEKLMLEPSKDLEVIGILEGNAGTLSNNLTGGLLFRAGVFNSYFSNYEKPGAKESSSTSTPYKKFQFLFFLRPSFTTFMDNSTLQGGYFTGKNSVQTIKTDDLTRYYLDFEAGFVIGHKRVGLSLSQRLRTAQYTDAPVQQFGNLTLFVGL